MNFNALEFTNHNSYHPSLIEHQMDHQSSSSIGSSNEAETSFFSTNNFFKKLGSGTLFTGRSSIFSNSIQYKNTNDLVGQQLNKNLLNNSNNIVPIASSSSLGSNNIILPNDYLKNSIILNATTFTEEAWQRQIEYDKFMNEIWIGIVLTLIIISMIFCICSCFLYHQFRLWKMNYRRSVQQNQDIESVKFNLEDDDPVPQYTLVSGLPSYEAALDMLKKSPDISTDEKFLSSCIGTTTTTTARTTYPSVFSIFTKNEKISAEPSILQNSIPIILKSTSPSSSTASLPIIEKASSLVELKSLVNNNTIQTITNSTNNNSEEENYENYHLINRISKNESSSTSLTLLKAITPVSTTTTTSNGILETNDVISESSSDEDDNCVKLSRNQEVIPLKNSKRY